MQNVVIRLNVLVQEQSRLLRAYPYNATPFTKPGTTHLLRAKSPQYRLSCDEIPASHFALNEDRNPTPRKWAQTPESTAHIRGSFRDGITLAFDQAGGSRAKVSSRLLLRGPHFTSHRKVTAEQSYPTLQYRSKLTTIVRPSFCNRSGNLLFHACQRADRHKNTPPLTPADAPGAIAL